MDRGKDSGRENNYHDEVIKVRQDASPHTNCQHIAQVITVARLGWLLSKQVSVEKNTHINMTHSHGWNHVKV